ncbi:MAG: hypothetical protein AAFZ52_11225, partial [Bacteroidota bacterium]
VAFDLWEPPYLHYAAATDTTREKYNFSMAGNWLSFSGHDTAATRVMDAYAREMGMDTTRYEGLRDRHKPVESVVDSLLLRAEEHEIVIINEAHHEPRHRVFTRQMLQGLYNRGYRHFGLETLSAFAGYDTLAPAEGYVGLKHGYYTRDPQFAAMVQEARQIGYSLFGYEKSGTGSPKLRELGQMRNIMAYRQDHPEGKLLLHVGYSHANEGWLGGRWEKAMAQRLADTTGLDPLTINQTHFREMSRREYERFEYQDFAPEDEPVLFYDKTTNEKFGLGDTTRWFDYYVFHPRTRRIYGRPDYVFAFDQRPVYLDFSQMPEPGPYLVQAYALEDDMTNTVPRDVVELDGSKSRALALPAGDYRLLVSVPDGRQWTTSIIVE